MTMSFLPFEATESYTGPDSIPSSRSQEPVTGNALLHIPKGKLRIPDVPCVIDRPRIARLLESSIANHPATLVCGRSGTGKTAIVASYAKGRKDSGWNTLEPPDVHWASFANSTLTAIRSDSRSSKRKLNTEELIATPETRDISRFVDQLFDEKRKRKKLLVLDNVHYVFDTSWFHDLFELILPAVPESSHVIFIARSKPPFPLWRMRSKQFLNVIDEKVFAFDEPETVELFKQKGLPSKLAKIAHQNCFGKVSQMLRFAEASAES
jgi:ATP/maltotriose-dependent transcriptional regulator MalT